MMYYVPSRRVCARGRRPKVADVDLAVIERLLSGDTTLSPNWHELDAAIKHIQAADRTVTSHTIAHRLGITRETVWRHNDARAIA